MLLGKARPKISMSYSTRKIRLGIAHHGTPSAWTAPVYQGRDVQPVEHKPKKRR